MASLNMHSVDFVEDLICPVCLEVFNQPVILECGHNYCKNCIDQFWDHEDKPQCPECRSVCLGSRYTINRLLSRLVEKTHSLALRQNVDRSTDPEKQVQLCEIHKEGLKLFCEDCLSSVCLICRDSQKHRGHSFLPFEEAEQLLLKGYENELKVLSSTLESQLKDIRELQSKQEQKKTDTKNDTRDFMQYITSEFAKMYQFLREKEEQLIQQLRKAETEIIKELDWSLVKVERDVNKIQKVLSDIHSWLQYQRLGDLSVLKDARNLSRKSYADLQQDEDSKGCLKTRNQRLGLYRGPLQYCVWKKMKSILNPAPVSLLLDPDTANRRLILSEGQTSVKYSLTYQQYCPHPERFESLLAVLGSERVTSGRHYWEVIVGNKIEWHVGVIRDSIRRQGLRAMNPESGGWTLYLSNRVIYKACDSPPQILNLTKKPQKIGVYVDYEGGQVSFYDADDMSHLYTFTDTFTDVLRLYLNPCDNEFGNNLDPLKLFHLKL
ncbi:zinc-binding protein A33-like [Protopterus annectens]|uniref:zinc-binding protein A33-like n=1 Tax=Protopterus annectens TaxID=7888 RepID=UPI001CFB8B14|nr:zinc-binding protein A33-like [Protopterus annectens]